MRLIHLSLLSLIPFVLFIPLVGCGNKVVGPAEGQVEFSDGSPVASGSIEFRERSTRSRFNSRIAADGSFAPESSEGDLGLPPGIYEVVVAQIVLTEDLAIEDHLHGNTVPRRYADYYTSDLEVTVGEGDSEPLQIVIDLQ